jgi:hypothetical protein
MIISIIIKRNGLMKNVTLFLMAAMVLSRCTLDQQRDGQEQGYLGTLKSKNSVEISGSYWGIQASTLEDTLLDKAADIGVKWTRLGASWPSIEKEKGIYDWSETDIAFTKIYDKGITPFVTLGSGNKLYTELTTYDDPKLAEIYGYRPAPPTRNPEALKAWLRYVRATV